MQLRELRRSIARRNGAGKSRLEARAAPRTSQPRVILLVSILNGYDVSDSQRGLTCPLSLFFPVFFPFSPSLRATLPSLSLQRSRGTRSTVERSLRAAVALRSFPSVSTFFIQPLSTFYRLGSRSKGEREIERDDTLHVVAQRISVESL